MLYILEEVTQRRKSMLSKIKLYAIAIGSALAAIFYALFKIERHKRKEAETQVKIHEKKEEITEYMEEAEVTERIREEEEIQRKAEVTRNASVTDLDDYISRKL